MSSLLRCVLMALVLTPACSVRAQEAVTSLTGPVTEGITSVEEAMQTRRSVRCFDPGEALGLDQVSQILWAAQGITARGRLRTAPSAGALYPFTIYLVAERVDSLDPGIYRYLPLDNSLELLREGNFLADISTASLNQIWMNQACILIALVADYSVITGVYGDRGVMYTHMEAGHISQNVYLQCVSLGLGTCAVGAFEDGSVDEILDLPEGETSVYLMPVGVPD